MNSYDHLRDDIKICFTFLKSRIIDEFIMMIVYIIYGWFLCVLGYFIFIFNEIVNMIISFYNYNFFKDLLFMKKKKNKIIDKIDQSIDTPLSINDNISKCIIIYNISSRRILKELDGNIKDALIQLIINDEFLLIQQKKSF